MTRHEFITLIGGVAAAWPLAARAQQPPLPARWNGALSFRNASDEMRGVVKELWPELVHKLPPKRTFRCCSELEAKGTEFYGGTLHLIATKEPPSSTNQPGHRSPPSCGRLRAARRLQ